MMTMLLVAVAMLAMGFVCGVYAYLLTYVHFKKHEEVRAAKRIMIAEQKVLHDRDGMKQVLERLRARYGMDLSEKHAEGPSEEIEQILSKGPHGGTE